MASESLSAGAAPRGAQVRAEKVRTREQEDNLISQSECVSVSEAFFSFPVVH